MRRFPPERIVCLTEETVETLYLLGEEDRIVGVHRRPEQAIQLQRHDMAAGVTHHRVSVELVDGDAISIARGRAELAAVCRPDAGDAQAGVRPPGV